MTFERNVSLYITDRAHVNGTIHGATAQKLSPARKGLARWVVSDGLRLEMVIGERVHPALPCR
jgi:hypothetical protein